MSYRALTKNRKKKTIRVENNPQLKETDFSEEIPMLVAFHIFFISKCLARFPPAADQRIRGGHTCLVYAESLAMALCWI